jgi:peptidoglycan pentaglycine glycine transferase (the first glycine)
MAWMTNPMEAKPAYDRSEWNHIVASLPGGHLLQSWEWGQFKEKYGWQAQRLSWFDSSGSPCAAAQILRRGLPLPILGSRAAVLYCPRGPALDWSNTSLRRQILTDLTELATQEGAIFLKIDPDIALGYGLPSEQEAEDNPIGQTLCQEMVASGWRASSEQIQFRNTLKLDLSLPEEALLAGMKQKTRYNVRLAMRRGVIVRSGSLEDLDLLYRLYAETSIRDGFVIRHVEYYKDAWGSFIDADLAQPLIAEVDGEPVAALVVFRFADTATYMYGMSSQAHREKMASHLLQWEAVRWAKKQGCTTYDFWGAPEQLAPQDPMWGVYRFKQGFGARLVRTIGAMDYLIQPTLYWLYAVVMPGLLSILRARGKAQTHRQLQ